MFVDDSSEKHDEALPMSFDAMKPAIHVEGLGKSYRTYSKPIDRLKQSIFKQRQYYKEFHALQNINLTVEKGSSLGIIGKNGSGKSTLLQMICGTLTPTTGSIKTNGKIAALLELGSGFNPDFTGIENIFLNASIFGLSRQETEERLDAILSFADIGDFVHQPLKTYSSGMVVRLAFAVITNVNAEILVIDEALAVGDIFFTQKCSRFMRSFREQGTLLFVSHDMDSLKSLCDQAVLLEQGTMRMKGETKDVADLYFGEAFGRSTNEQNVETDLEVEASIQTSDSANDAGTGTLGVRPRARLHPWFDVRQQAFGDQRYGAVMQASDFSEAIRNSERFGDNNTIEFIHVGLVDPIHNTPQQSFYGGYPYVLSIVCRCHQTIKQPDIGFCLNDKLGQVLFGDNTNTVNDGSIWQQGRAYQIDFEFDMPILRTGEYTITVAAQEHKTTPPVILNWIHDALLLYTQHSSTAVGLSGIPMRRIMVAPHQAAALEPAQSIPGDALENTALSIRQQRDEQYRVALTCSCRDSDVIPKVDNAGAILNDPQHKNPVQVMHNGLKVLAGGYYGSWMSEIIKNLNGHHEPQEELIFHKILERLNNQPGSMIELGSFWSYYSLWFLKQNPLQRQAICLEADPIHLQIGQDNAQLNQLSPVFVNGFAGETASEKPLAFPTEQSGVISIHRYSVDHLIHQHQLDRVNILHIDTQGAEFSVLKGAQEAIKNKKIRFVVLSTHSYEICGDPLIHQRCLAWLQAKGAQIICEHDVHESFSGDGLIVASFSTKDTGWTETISRNRYSTSLFPNPAYYVPMRPQESPAI